MHILVSMYDGSSDYSHMGVKLMANKQCEVNEYIKSNHCLKEEHEIRKICNELKQNQYSCISSEITYLLFKYKKTKKITEGNEVYNEREAVGGKYLLFVMFIGGSTTIYEYNDKEKANEKYNEFVSSVEPSEINDYVLLYDTITRTSNGRFLFREE